MRRINQSETRTYKQCRRRWWLSHHRNLELMDRPVTGNLSIGNAVHQALSMMEDPEFAGAVPEAVDALRESYALKLDARPEMAKEITSELELVRIMLEGFADFVAEQGLLEDLRVYATEALLEAPIQVDGETVTLHGTIDARVERLSTGARLFREYKTAADLARPGHTLHQDEQVLFYMLLERLQQVAGATSIFEPVEGCAYFILRKVKRTKSAKPPFYAMMEVRHGDEELRSFYRRTLAVIRDVLRVERDLAAGADPTTLCYPTPTGDCHWRCEWYGVCPHFDDGGDAEGLLATIATQRDRKEVSDDATTNIA